ncbi:MAG TPA: CoA transferase, partial [Candidatus Binataceae bacterium]|nr:CoA transferase [Candidatus Binataceae bacterium]
VLARNGDTAPTYFDPPVADTSGALYAVIAILGALQARRAGGTGCHIDLALADVPMSLQLFQVADFGANATVPGRNRTYLNGGAAYYRIYATADGRHLVLSAVEPKFWSNFCAAAGRLDWISRHGDPIPQHDLIRELEPYFADLNLADCLARFGGDCMVSPVLELDEALATDHVLERGIVRRAEAGDLQALFPARIDGEPPATRPPLRLR